MDKLERIEELERIEKKALRYLYGNIEEDNMLFLNLSLTAKEDESYNNDLAAFKKLFNSGDRKLQMAAWNALRWMNNFAKEDFTDEQAAFLTQFCNAASNYVYVQNNPNRAFSTERLILRPAIKAEELQMYHQHLRKDGDFSLYTGRKLSSRALSYYTLDRPYCFAIYEKKSKKMIGMVGLYSYEEKKCMASAEWYIFKSYRQNGYAQEAVTALIKRAFSGKLAEWRQTYWRYVYRKHYAKIDLVRVHIRETNTASQALAESCGFIYQYTDKRCIIVEGKGYEDAKVYELTPYPNKA